jgi:hypothetical protein
MSAEIASRPSHAATFRRLESPHTSHAQSADEKHKEGTGGSKATQSLNSIVSSTTTGELNAAAPIPLLLSFFARTPRQGGALPWFTLRSPRISYGNNSVYVNCATSSTK